MLGAVDDRTDREPADVLKAVRDFTALDLPTGLLFPAFGSGRAESHVVGWLMIGGGVGVVVAERRGARVVTADADQLRSSWFPIDWRCAEAEVACRGDLSPTNQPAFLRGDALWSAWQRSQVHHSACVARVTVAAADMHRALRVEAAGAETTLRFRPGRNEVRVGAVSVAGEGGAGRPASFTAARTMLADFFDFDAWPVRVTVAVAAAETGLPLVVYLADGDEETSEPSWPSGRGEVERWLLWGALRAGAGGHVDV